MMRTRLALSIVVLAPMGAFACVQLFGIDDGILVSVPEGGSDANGDSGPDAGCAGRITVTKNDHFVTNNGPVPSSWDFTDAGAAVFVIASDGGLTTYPGQGTLGSFTVDGVPDCVEYYVTPPNRQTGTATWVFAKERNLDVSEWVVGKPVGPSADGGAQLALNVTGLTPWTPSDVLGMWAVDSNFIGLVQPFNPGDVMGVANFDIRSVGGDTWLLQNDTLYVLDTAFVDASVMAGATLSTVRQSYVATNVTTPSGQTTTIDAALTATGQSTTINIAWDHSAFALHAGELNPTLQGINQFIFIDPNPVGGHGYITGSPDFATYVLPNGNGSLESFPVTFNNPFPAQWAIDVGASFFTNVDITLDSPTAEGGVAQTQSGFYGASFFCLFGVSGSDVLTPDGGPMAPLVSPVLIPKINGQDLFTHVTGVGVEPTLSWNAPSLGTVTTYYVTVRELSVNAVKPSRVNVDLLARIFTSSTTLRIPPGILELGKQYDVSIDASYSAGIPSTSPTLFAWPQCDATILSGVFAP